MMERADVVVVGGGCMGASLAYHLLKRDSVKVVLLERDSLASGQTGKSSATVSSTSVWGFGEQTEPDMTKLSKRSFDTFKNFDSEFGGPCGFKQSGGLITGSAKDEKMIQEMAKMNEKRGIEGRLFELDELREAFPFFKESDVSSGLYSGEIGYCDPILTTSVLAKRARELGCEVEQGVEAQSLRSEKGEIIGVRTNRGDIATDHVAVCAGAWATNLLRPLGVNVPLMSRSAPHCVFKRPTDFAGSHPVLIDFSSGVYLRPDVNDTTIVGYSDPNKGEKVDPDAQSQTIDHEALLDMTQRSCRLIGAFTRAISLGGYTCVYDMTPDESPIIGSIPSTRGLFLAVGNSGHGFKYSPAVGESLAELMLAGSARDLNSLGIERFGGLT